jgi:hypothetical protein
MQSTAHVFHVYDPDANQAFRVDLEAADANMITPLKSQDEVKDGGRVQAILGAVIYNAPEIRAGPQEHLTVNVGTPEPGNAGSTTSDGSSSGDTESQPVVSDAGTTDYDEEALIEAVDDWLSYKADDPASNLIDGAWSLSFKEFNNPNGGSEHGVYLESDPWHGPHWDNESSSWDSDDGEMPDEWREHSESWRNVVKADDSPTKGIPEENDDSDYTTWYNYVPADDAADLA